MKIYTYHQNLAGHSHQNELIDLWKISWSRQGYNPIVLNLEDAKKHTYFNTLDTEMRRIYKEIIGTDITEYGMSCWFRWHYMSEISSNLPEYKNYSRVEIVKSLLGLR